jgi:trehalose 6-phosphate synthase/phosphatase
VADAATLLARVRKANGLVLLLDYDGTLAPLERSPELARPDEPLTALLRDLAAKSYHVHLLSGRTPDTLATWFGNLPAALWAEHGAWHRPGPEHEWRYLGPPSTGWMQQIRPILEQFTAYTPGALIEQKAASIAWHYRVADPEFARKQARELRVLLEEAVRNQPLEVLEGSKVIEIRYRGVNKANVVERIVRSEGASVAGGLRRRSHGRGDVCRAAARAHLDSCRAGAECALFRLSDTSAVRELLHKLAAGPA